MDSLIFTIIVVWTVFWILGKVIEIRIARETQREEMLDQLEQRLPVGLVIEEINGVVYGWDHKTNDFVCQGRYMEQFRDAFRTRYPNRSATIVDGPDELMQRFKTELKSILQNENLNSQ